MVAGVVIEEASPGKKTGNIEYHFSLQHRAKCAVDALSLAKTVPFHIDIGAHAPAEIVRQWRQVNVQAQASAVARRVLFVQNILHPKPHAHRNGRKERGKPLGFILFPHGKQLRTRFHV